MYTRNGNKRTIATPEESTAGRAVQTTLTYSVRESTVKQISAGHILDNARILLDARGYQDVRVDTRVVDSMSGLVTIEEGNYLLSRVVAKSTEGHMPYYTHHRN